MTALATLISDSDLALKVREAIATPQRGRLEQAEEHLHRVLAGLPPDHLEIPAEGA